MDNQSEVLRNRLLRRADWRYLLGNPYPEKSTCLCDGLLSQAVQSVSSQFIPAEKAAADECDLVVATNPKPDAISRAWKVLHPGGNFYSEWYSPLAGGTKGIRRRLEAVGFSNVVCYWPWPVPDFSPALFWLPLDAPQAIRYFLSNRPQPANQFARAGSNVLKILWKLGQRTGMLAPICVTASKMKPAGRNASLCESQEEIFDIWDDDKTRGLSRRFDYLMWTGGKRSINKVILYSFPTGEGLPRLVVKLPRIPEAIPGLTHEAQILQALHANKSQAAKHAPKVLFSHSVNGMTALGETTVSGQPLYTVIDQSNIQGLAINVTEWLAGLTGGEPYYTQARWWDQIAEPALRDFEQSFGPVLDENVLPKCRAILGRLGDLPITFEHRDCSPWNLLITTSGELAVLDWESAEQYGLPAIDLEYFLANLAFFMDGAMKSGNFIESYRRASDPMTPTGRLQAACQRHYIECTGLDPAVLHPLRLLAWLIHTRSDIRHLTADAGGSPQPADLRRSLFFTLVLEELAQDQISARAGIN